MNQNNEHTSNVGICPYGRRCGVTAASETWLTLPAWVSLVPSRYTGPDLRFHENNTETEFCLLAQGAVASGVFLLSSH